MIKGISALIIFFAAVFCIKATGYGDVVRLKNGIVLTGDIIMETENEIVIKMVKYGEGRIKKFAISSIEYTGMPEVNYSVVSNGVAQEPKKEQTLSTNSTENKTENSNEPQKKNDDYFHAAFGINTGFYPMWSGYSMEDTENIFGVDMTTKQSMDFDANYYMNTGFFIDLMFLRFDIGYGFVLSTNTAATGTISTTASGIPIPIFAATNRMIMSYSYSYLSLSLLFKIPPSSTGPVSLWPALGVEYDFALTYNINGLNMMTNKDANLNNFWILAGGGMNIKLAEHFSIIPTILFGYNLRAALFNDTDTDPLSYSKSFSDIKLFAYGFKINVNLGFAFVL